MKSPSLALALCVVSLVLAAPAARAQNESVTSGADTLGLLEQYTRVAREGDPDARLETASRLVKVAPRSPRALLVLADAQAAAGRVGDARKSASRAIAADPGSVTAYAWLVRSCLVQAPTDPEEAEKVARRATTAAPDEPAAWDALGDALRARGALPAARDAYGREIELAPARPDGYAQRAEVATVLGRPDEARADYALALARANGNDRVGIRIGRALVALYAGARAQALAELDAVADSVRALDVADTLAAAIDVRRAQAVLELHAGDVDAATRAVGRLTPLLGELAGRQDAEPRRAAEAEAALFEGWLAARRRDFFDARGKARTMIAAMAGSRDPRRDEGSEKLLGLLELYQKNYRYAAHHLERADPTDPYVMYQLAVSLGATAHKADATDLYRRVATYAFVSAWAAVVRDDARARSR